MRHEFGVDDWRFTVFKSGGAALRNGVRSIEHGNLLDDRSVELFRDRDAFLVPTLVTYWALKEEGRADLV